MITLITIGITVVISLYAFNDTSAKRKFIFNPYLVQTQNQHYRFITSGFIHQDYPHLVWNMISFYFFGTTVEEEFNIIFESAGEVYFIALYLLGIIVSDIPTYFKHRNNPGYNALGASGGVASVIFASIIFQPLQYICLYFALCLPGFILGSLYLVWSYFQGRRAQDNINHDAHLYGALFGLVFCIILYPPSILNFFNQVAEWSFFDSFL